MVYLYYKVSQLWGAVRDGDGCICTRCYHCEALWGMVMDVFVQGVIIVRPCEGWYWVYLYKVLSLWGAVRDSDGCICSTRCYHYEVLWGTVMDVFVQGVIIVRPCEGWWWVYLFYKVLSLWGTVRDGDRCICSTLCYHCEALWGTVIDVFVVQCVIIVRHCQGCVCSTRCYHCDALWGTVMDVFVLKGVIIVRPCQGCICSTSCYHCEVLSGVYLFYKLLSFWGPVSGVFVLQVVIIVRPCQGCICSTSCYHCEALPGTGVYMWTCKTCRLLSIYTHWHIKAIMLVAIVCVELPLPLFTSCVGLGVEH